MTADWLRPASPPSPTLLWAVAATVIAAVNGALLLVALSARSPEVGGPTQACSDWVAQPVGADRADDFRSWSKWVPPVSPCLVQGQPIEALEPHLNFRRGYSLGFADDVEDKTHVLLFLRAAHDANMQARHRRVYIDFGGKNFESSVSWFLRLYPLDFTEIYVFEVRENVFRLPPVLTPAQEEAQFQAMDSSSRERPKGAKPPHFPAAVLKRIRIFNKFAGTTDTASPPHVNVTRWMLEDLQLNIDDAVVIKMDVEGAEWSILPEWLALRGMSQVVDELFVEVHYDHPTLYRFGWGPDRFNKSRDDATQLLNRLRAAGFYVHPWP